MQIPGRVWKMILEKGEGEGSTGTGEIHYEMMAEAVNVAVRQLREDTKVTDDDDDDDDDDADMEFDDEPFLWAPFVYMGL